MIVLIRFKLAIMMFIDIEKHREHRDIVYFAYMQNIQFVIP
jgi:hypothetical protein